LNSRAPRALALAAALLAGSGCATNPVTGEREFTLTTAADEAQQGRAAAAQVEAEMGLVEDAALTGYVAQIGARLAALSPRKDTRYSFHVVNMQEPNAFALPGGYVYVSRGLLALTRHEDELANVVGHEIGHVAARHSAQRQTRAAGVGILSALGTVAAAVLGGADAAAMASQLGQIAGAGLIASYSRDQEREADRVGQQLAASAGWDPAAMASFLASLERETRLRGQSRRPSFLDSHPATPERAAATATFARQLSRGPGGPIARTQGDYLRRLEGLLVGPDPAEGIVRDSTFLHPELDFRLRFPDGWQVQNGRSALAALSPQRDALVQLTLAGRGSDPRAAAQKDLSGQRLEVLQSGATRVGSLPAFRVLARGATQQGTVGAEFTYIAYRGRVYRLQGMAPAESFAVHSATFGKIAQTFRPLTASERALCKERRLAIVAAREGETLAELSRRSGNAWSLDETAVLNGMNETSRLRVGEFVKVAIERPYTP
jgi:predicted Zn-dependent protease